MDKNYGISSAQRKIIGLQSGINTLENLISDEIQADYAFVYEDNIVICIPYDLERARYTEEQLQANGWERTGEHLRKDSGELDWHYKHPDYLGTLRLNLDTTRPGSTCVRRQISVREWPVYEITCGQEDF